MLECDLAMADDCWQYFPPLSGYNKHDGCQEKILVLDLILLFPMRGSCQQAAEAPLKHVVKIIGQVKGAASKLYFQLIGIDCR